MLIRRVLVLGLILNSVSLTRLNNAYAGEILQRDVCESMGRVIHSYDSGILPGSEVCKDSHLIVGKGLKVFVGCFQGGKGRWLLGGRHDVNQLCAYQRTVEGSCWFLLNLVDCKRSNDGLVILSPRSPAVLSTADLEWKKVKGASDYEVIIKSDLGEEYRIRTVTSMLTLSSKDFWKAGSFFRIRVVAYQNEEILSEGKSTIRVPSEEEMQEILALISSIESSLLPIIDQVRLVDSVYMSMGLTYESIRYIENSSIDKKSLIVANILAERYSQVGDPERAKVKYQIVADKSSQTSEDGKFARMMLDRIALYQAYGG